MLILSPQFATRPCGECKKWVYNDKPHAVGNIGPGEIKTRGGKKIKRPTPHSTPCRLCPKKSPAEAHKYELTEANWKTLELYYSLRSIGWPLTEEYINDQMFRRNMAIVDRVIRASEQKGEAASIGQALSQTLQTLMPHGR